MSEILKKAINPKLNRRSFLKWSAGVSGALAASGALQNVQQASAAGQEIKVPTTCGRSNCGDTCPWVAVVKDGVWIRTELNENVPNSPPYFRYPPCVKGISYRKHTYSPKRLKYPMKRKHWAPGGGDRTLRGKDEWIRISWDEATSLIAQEMIRVKSTYGPTAFYQFTQSGRVGSANLQGDRWLISLFARHGGFVPKVGTYSWPTRPKAQNFCFGTSTTGSDPWDILNSNFLILWSDNAYDTGGMVRKYYYLRLAKEQGIPMVAIDPYYHRTAQLTDEWIPIRPQTDEALALAMLYVLFKEYGAYIDQPWIEARSVGIFPRKGAGTPTDPTVPADDCLKHFVLGLGADGNPAPSGHKNYPAKTPAWAEGQTGIPTAKIAELARRYADNSYFKGEGKKAKILSEGGTNRRQYGENAYWLWAALQTVTKNIGREGGGSGIDSGVPSPVPIGSVTTWPNPIADTHNFEVGMRTRAFNKKLCRIEQGPDMYKRWWRPDLKFFFVSTGNSLNQNNDINQCLRSYKDMECIIVADPIFTVTCQFADIVLPICTAQETQDISGRSYHQVFFNRCIEPLFEAKTDMEAATLIAKKLGYTDFNPKTEEEWLQTIWNPTAQKWSGLTLSQFKEKGFAAPDLSARLASPFVAFKAFIANPATDKPKTPSGKIEFYSMTVKSLIDGGYVNPKIVRPIPSYPPRMEGPGDPVMDKYPLACMQIASGKRTHSTNDDSIVAWMREIAPEESNIVMNTDDAEVRGIKTGDWVRIYNDRGEAHILAFVTNRVAKGVTIFFRGTYYNPKEPGVIGSPSIGGGPSVLTAVDIPVTINRPEWPGEPVQGALIQGTPSGSCAVQIKKL